METHQLNLRHLAVVAAVKATGSVSATARAIHLTQPAITQCIAKLERQLDVLLFVRRPDGVEATPAGEVLADRVDIAMRLIGSRRATNAQIRAFRAFAASGTYAAAAQATGLSEASLHRAVSDLQFALGARLLERRGRGLQLTRRGKDVARRLNLAMIEIESAMVDIAALAGRETGRVTIGAMPLARARLLPETVAAFRRSHPGTDLAIIEGPYSELIGPLREGRIDVMIGALRDNPPPDLVVMQLLLDIPRIVGRFDHPLSRAKGPIALEALLAYPWLVPARGTPLRALWERMFRALGAEPPHVSIECGSSLLVRQLLINSDHLTLFSLDQISVELEANWLAAFGVAPGELARTIGATVRADWRPTASQAHFLGTLEQTASTMRNFIRKN